MSGKSDRTLDLDTAEYHERLSDPGESFVRHYETEYSRLVQPQATDRILELGCSSERMTEVLLATGAAVTGLDFDERACDLARQRVAPFGQRP